MVLDVAKVTILMPNTLYPQNLVIEHELCNRWQRDRAVQAPSSTSIGKALGHTEAVSWKLRSPDAADEVKAYQPTTDE